MNREQLRAKLRADKDKTRPIARAACAIPDTITDEQFDQAVRTVLLIAMEGKSPRMSAEFILDPQNALVYVNAIRIALRLPQLDKLPD